MEYFSEALQLMLLGVGVVFVFLLVLILAIAVMSSTVQKFFPEKPKAAQNSIATAEQETIFAAAVAAVHLYRQRHQS